MRRTDRLVGLIQILRDGRLHTSRDTATLIASGLPVEGERGVGYIRREPVTVPPLTLIPDQLQALILGLQLVTSAADPSLVHAVDSLRAKISAVLPARLMDGVGQGTWVFSADEALAAARHLPASRLAVRLRELVVIDYIDGSGNPGERPVRPLLLEFWSRVWTLATWCETRQGFRSFRVDRIEGLHLTGETFPDDPDTTLADWRRLHAVDLADR